MIEVKDEILNGEPKYRLKDENGNIIYDNLSIEQITPTVQEGTPINKLLFDSIKNDVLDRLLISDKATTAEAQAGTNDTKYMTALKVLEQINAKALPSKQMSIKTGTISHNSVIPQTNGYSKYMYFVSMNSGTQTDDHSSISSITCKIGIKCAVDQSTRKVTAQIGLGFDTNGDYTILYNSGIANYIEIAWN